VGVGGWMGDCLWVGCVCGVESRSVRWGLLEGDSGVAWWWKGILCWNEMDVC